jgi:hypothetical protein
LRRSLILMPFDPLIIQRKRTLLFFDYEHRFEAYVPKDKRLFGYFALPVLVGGEIVAAIDLKTNRANKKLLMQKWSWVGQAARGARKDLKRRIEEELDKFESSQHFASQELIIVWLEVRVLPAPPRSLAQTEISRLVLNSPRTSGDSCTRFVSASCRLDIRDRFGSFVSAHQNSVSPRRRPVLVETGFA